MAVFGNQDTTGASFIAWNSKQGLLCRFQCPEDGDLDSISVYIGNQDTGTGINCAIYADNGGQVGSLIAQGAGQTLVPNSWNTVPITAPLTANTYYWLAARSNGDWRPGIIVGGGSTNQLALISTKSPAYPDFPTAPAGTYSSDLMCIYADYTPAGGGSQQKTVADSGSLGDTVVPPSVSFGITDSGIGTESFSGQNSFSIQDNLSTLEALQILNQLLVNEDGTFNDQVASVITDLLVNEDGTFNDQAIFVVNSLLIGDVGTLSDQITSLIRALLVTDSGALSDQISSISNLLSVIDAATLSDQLAPIIVSILLQENGTFFSTINIVNSLIVLEQAFGSEVISVIKYIFKTVLDHAIGFDDLAALNVTLSQQDSGIFSDAQDVLISASIKAIESGSFSDTVSITKELLKVIYDQLNGAENLSIFAQTNVTEAGSFSTVVQALASLLVSDIGLLTDVLSVIKEALKVISDSAVASESISISLGTLLVSDFASGQDQVLSQALINLLDQALASENVSLSSLVKAYESGNLTDQVWLAEKFLSILESAQGSEAINLLKNIVVEGIRKVFIYELQKDFVARAIPNNFSKDELVRNFVKELTKRLDKKAKQSKFDS